jgi:hypothetical protein
MKTILLLRRWTYLFVLIFCSEMSARIIQVPGDFATIQAGIFYAVDGDTVLVDTGTYVEHIDFSGKAILVTSYYMYTGDTITINNTVIDGDSSGRVVVFTTGEDSNSVINGFKIMNGFTTTYGGGIYCQSATCPLITNCWVTKNVSLSIGGGIFGENLTIINCRVTENTASMVGGGVYCDSTTLRNCTISENDSQSSGGGVSGSNTAFENCAFVGNTASVLGAGVHGTNVVFDSCTFNGNSTLGLGGGIHGSSMICRNCTFIGNAASVNGGGVYGNDAMFENCTFTGNGAGNGGAGYINGYNTQTTFTDCAIIGNAAGYGGGVYCVSDVTFTNCTINRNTATFGGGVYVQVFMSGSVNFMNCRINRNSALMGGAVECFHSYITFSNCQITGNTATEAGGAGYNFMAFSTFKKCVMSENSSTYGGVFYDTLESRVMIDSCLIVDNGNTENSVSGLLYLASDGNVVQLSYSHVYYNTFQPDTEIYNNAPITLPLENNFWWDTTDAGIASLIHGLADYTPWLTSMIPAGVPGEPLAIDSVRNYTDATYTTICDSIGEYDTLYIRIYGTDRNPCFREAGVAIMKSSIYVSGIAVALLETDTSSGVYQGIAQPIERSDIDSIRIDDIYQRIGVNTSGDTIWIIANMDKTQNFPVGYKAPCPGVIEIPSRIHSNSTFFSIKGNPAVNQACFSYCLQEGLDAEIVIYDISGRKVKEWTIKGNNLQNELLWNTEGMSAGVYFVHFKSGSITSSNKLVLIQ